MQALVGGGYSRELVSRPDSSRKRKVKKIDCRESIEY